MLHTVTIPASAMHAAASLIPFASKDKLTPILIGVAVSIAGGEFRATATDRYVVGDYSTTIDDDTAELPAVLIPTDLLATYAKAGARFGTVTLTHDDDSQALTIDYGTGAVRGYATAGNIPPVRRLFPEQTYDLPSFAGINPERFAKLAKIKNPTTGRYDDKMGDPWKLTGAGDGDRSPVFATLDYRGGHAFRALIQPVTLR